MLPQVLMEQPCFSCGFLSPMRWHQLLVELEHLSYFGKILKHCSPLLLSWFPPDHLHRQTHSANMTSSSSASSFLVLVFGPKDIVDQLPLLLVICHWGAYEVQKSWNRSGNLSKSSTLLGDAPGTRCWSDWKCVVGRAGGECPNSVLAYRGRNVKGQAGACQGCFESCSTSGKHVSWSDCLATALGVTPTKEQRLRFGHC